MRIAILEKHFERQFAQSSHDSHPRTETHRQRDAEETAAERNNGGKDNLRKEKGRTHYLLISLMSVASFTGLSSGGVGFAGGCVGFAGGGVGGGVSFAGGGGKKASGRHLS